MKTDAEQTDDEKKEKTFEYEATEKGNLPCCTSPTYSSRVR